MDAQAEIIFWVVVLMAVLIVGVIAAAILKRKLVDQPDHGAPDAGAGGLLEELRAAHARGELTDEQFSAARERLLAAATGRFDRGDGAHRPARELAGERAATRLQQPDHADGTDGSDTP